MKKIETRKKATITVLDANIDALTPRQEYCYAEYPGQTVFENEIFGYGVAKIASFTCAHYAYDNYVVITNNPILITLLIECGRISIDKDFFQDLADIPDSKIKEYNQLTN